MSRAGSRAAMEGSATTPLCIREAKSRDPACERGYSVTSTYPLGGPGIPPTTPPTTPPAAPPATPPSTPNGTPATPPSKANRFDEGAIAGGGAASAAGPADASWPFAATFLFLSPSLDADRSASSPGSLRSSATDRSPDAGREGRGTAKSSAVFNVLTRARRRLGIAIAAIAAAAASDATEYSAMRRRRSLRAPSGSDARAATRSRCAASSTGSTTGQSICRSRPIASSNARRSPAQTEHSATCSATAS